MMMAWSREHWAFWLSMFFAGLLGFGIQGIPLTNAIIIVVAAVGWSLFATIEERTSRQ